MSRERLIDGLLVVLLVAALAQAALLLRGGVDRRYVPLLSEGDPPGTLQGPGAASRVLRARGAAVGEFVTIEDLARGALALRDGQLPGAAPLSASEAARLQPLLEKAAQDRKDLLAVEGEIAGVQAEIQEKAAAIAATLTPEQRAWIIANRDDVSVGQVEQAYWDELLGTPP